MIKYFSHFQSNLDTHEAVKLNTCLSVKYSTKNLVDSGYDINPRKRRYCLSNNAKENVLNEKNVNVGGRPTLENEKKEKVISFLLDVSTESRTIKKDRFFFLYIIYSFAFFFLNLDKETPEITRTEINDSKTTTFNAKEIARTNDTLSSSDAVYYIVDDSDKQPNESVCFSLSKKQKSELKKEDGFFFLFYLYFYFHAFSEVLKIENENVHILFPDFLTYDVFFELFFV
jgi:hypothetical protein